MELTQPNIINRSNETIELRWGKFTYTLAPGEKKLFPAKAVKAIVARFKDKAFPYFSEENDKNKNGKGIKNANT